MQIPGMQLRRQWVFRQMRRHPIPRILYLNIPRPDQQVISSSNSPFKTDVVVQVGAGLVDLVTPSISRAKGSTLLCLKFVRKSISTS